MNLALFDLDHTLLPLDSDHSWGQFTVKLGWRDGEQFAKANDDFYQQYKAGTLDINAYIRFGTQSLRDLGDDASSKAAAAHEQFMAQVILPAIRPSAQALVERHRSAGDEIVLVTATNAFITAPIAKALGIEHLIAVDLVLDAQGVPTGDILGTPSFREGKVARVEQWLAQRGVGWADVGHSYFYSDSINDLPLLERASHPVATNPDDRLRAIATERGWSVLDLFND
jgi:HAD superfamily hydrolase (TIGR01490 family)